MAVKVIVTGQPRTGTSFLTSLAQKITGGSLGAPNMLKQPDDNNPRGYYECLPILGLEDKILAKLGGTLRDMPDLEPGWQQDFDKEKQELRRIVMDLGVEVFKSPRGFIMGDLVQDVFPKAKWLFSHRPAEAMYNSRFGNHIPMQEWFDIVDRRHKAFERTGISRIAYRVPYINFTTPETLAAEVKTIALFLRVKLTDKILQECLESWQPRN